jgi:hypothetical protein
MAVPRVHMLANEVVGHVDRDDIVQKIKQGYGYDLIGILPFAEEMARLGSDSICPVCYPTHPLSKESKLIAERIME